MSLSNSITIKPVSVSNIVFSFFLPDSSLHWGLFFQTGESQLTLAALTPVGKASKANKNNKIFFKLKKERIYFDLTKFIRSQLISFGILKIDVINKDTFDKKNNFFSARRSLKRKELDYGRNISVIMLK
jgi:copper oxidase (laccase) domain-containing protein